MTDTINIAQWTKTGIGIVRCDALDPDHPMHPYNQALAQGVRPEDFGIENPLAEAFAGHSRDDLIAEILALRRQISACGY